MEGSAAGGGEGLRGREARTPRQVPPRGWRDVLLRTKQQIKEDNVGLVSAGVAYYLFLALFPAIAALFTLYALVADPAQIQEQIGNLGALPGQVRDLLVSQLEQQAQSAEGTLGLALAGSLLLALWSTTKGLRAAVQALNIAYGQAETRPFVRRTLLSIGLTAGTVVLAVVAVLAIGAVPAIVRWQVLGPVGAWAAVIAGWAVLIGCFLVFLAGLYRWGPNREPARWRWITPGAVLAVSAWVAASALFALYLANFDAYGETYGSLGSVVVMMLWLWISAFAVITGAELNAELERQTARDTTTGEPRRRGERGAHAADTLGQSP